MANLKEKVLGSVSGALGDIIFRNIKGKNVLSVKPASINIPGDPASIARRSRFTIAARLSGAINSNAKLKSLWQPAVINGLNVHNYLIRANYNSVTSDDIENTMKLVPSGGFAVTVVAIDKSAVRLRVDLEAIGTNSGIDPLAETKLQVLSLVFMSNPVAEHSAPYSFLVLSSDILDTSLDDPLTFQASLLSSQANSFNEYQNRKAFCALVTLDADGKIIRYSQNFNG